MTELMIMIRVMRIEAGRLADAEVKARCGAAEAQLT
jgi:hypothetical protein